MAVEISDEQISLMKDDFVKLDELFNSIIDEINHPDKAGTFVNPFVVERATRGNVSHVAYTVASVTETVSVIIVRKSTDSMSAYAKVVSNATSFKPYTAADIKKIANENGVFFGFNDDAINKMVEEQTVNKEVLIAEGIPPVDGKDGSLEMNFELQEEGTITGISKGTEICHIKNPKKGRDGKDVSGHVLKGKDGNEAVFPIGDGIHIKGTKAVADFAGTLVLRDGKYSVVNELVINRNVTQGDGIIGFEGTIIINGNVTMNSIIKAGRNIEINGVLSNSVLEAIGSVTITKKALNSDILAEHGNINGSEFTECGLTAGGGVRGEFISDCEVKCVTGIMCTDGVGRISGGNIYCAGDINCLFIGSREHIETKIAMGDVDEYVSRKKNIESRIGIINSELTKLSDQLNMLYEKKKEGTISLEEEGFLSAASRIRKQKSDERSPLLEEVKELEAIIKIAEKATLRAKTMIYGGAILNICGQNQVINSDTPHATVRSNGSTIVIT